MSPLYDRVELHISPDEQFLTHDAARVTAASGQYHEAEDDRRIVILPASERALIDDLACRYHARCICACLTPYGRGRLVRDTRVPFWATHVELNPNKQCDAMTLLDQHIRSTAERFYMESLAPSIFDKRRK